MTTLLDEAESTEHNRPSHWFRPGQSGNPKGRPFGARQKLGTAFIEALAADFEQHGIEAIKEVRETRPDKYLAVIGHLLPKELELSGEVSHTMLIELKEYCQNYRLVRQAQ